MSKIITYRPDIDGLRAISVFLVILFHVDFSLFSGGYVGVDIFFVISGYLITSSINKQILSNSFSFKEFYLRRIRRIIPVLVFVIVIITILAYLFLFPNDFESYSRTVVHTMLSTNNFYLWSASNDYFAKNTEFMPLLHTWSLSVEEQFYLVWPILLLVLHRFLNSNNRVYVVTALLFCTLLLSIYLTGEDKSMAYFLLPARFFEVLMGAILAILWERIPKLTKSINHIVSILGIVLVFIPSIVLTKESAFPGLNAFWPCLGAVLLILSGKEKDSKGVVNSVLEFRGIVFLGLLSYSIYLWHWPIIVFIKYLGFELTLPIVFMVVATTIVLSYFSWKFVEQPFRYTFKYTFSKTLRYILFPSLLIGGLTYGIIDGKDGFPDRFPNLTEFNRKVNFPDEVRSNCYNTHSIGNNRNCNIGVVKNKVDGILIGDSFANHSVYFVDELAKDANMYFDVSAAPGYPLLRNLDFPDTSGDDYEKKRFEYAKKMDIICIAAFWEAMRVDSENYDQILESIKELVALKKNVVIIDHLRMTTEANAHKMKLHKAKMGAQFLKKDLLIPLYERPEKYIVNEIKKRFPSVTIIDLNEVMCVNDKCDYAINEQIVYRDFYHLNVSGARLIAKKYLEEKGNPLRSLQ
ncbi:acyltransferase family protein [Aquimarina sp. 2304DJ70-9]|uniref:acyltransferase family protein n=1 Tax=Aquimarina penaris TaxID=3231044 RepID=UPI003462DD9A